MLTVFEDDDAVFAAIRAGASGYLIRGAEKDEIIRAIRSVAAGQAIFARPMLTTATMSKVSDSLRHPLPAVAVGSPV